MAAAAYSRGINERGIHVENKRRLGAKSTRITVQSWPKRRSNSSWTLSTSGTKGRLLIAKGWHDFKKDSWLGQADLHVPSRKERSLTVTGIELSVSLLTEERRDVVIELLACSKEIAVELKTHLNVGDGCLEWRVLRNNAAAMLRQHPTFAAVDVPAKQARALRGRRLLRRC